MPQFDLILRNCLVLQADFSILKNATLCIDKGRIVKIETDAEQPPTPGRNHPGCSGKLANPAGRLPHHAPATLRAHPPTDAHGVAAFYSFRKQPDPQDV